MKAPRAARNRKTPKEGPRSGKDLAPIRPEPEPDANWVTTAPSNRAMRRASKKAQK